MLARWHKAKEEILTKAVANSELSEQEADFLRIEIVKAEATEAETIAKKERDNVTAEQIVESMDENGDGRIRLEEASDDLKMYFQIYDSNQDGTIGLREAEAIANYVNKKRDTGNRYTAKQLMSMMDKNGDGKLSRDETTNEIQMYFGYIDKDGDGLIDSKEAQALVQ